MAKFHQCQRKYGLSYIEELERNPSAERRAPMLGSAFHEGVAAYLKSPDHDIRDAINTARAYVLKALEENILLLDANNNFTTDYDYYNMVTELQPTVLKMLEFYLPRLGIDTEWRVATMSELFPTRGFGIEGSLQRVVEKEFEIEYGGYTFKGIVDAVLVNLADDELVMVDWKTRAKFPQDALVHIDGQLPFYAALHNHIGANIKSVAMWQFLTSTPKPAVMLKSGQPSRDKKKLGATTWEAWSSTLPLPHKPEKYEAEFRPLMGSIERFIYTAWDEITDRSSSIALRNAVSTAKAIDAAHIMYKSGMPLPAVLSSMGCQFCEFQALCEAPLKFGFPPDDIVVARYRRKEHGTNKGK